MNDLLGRYLVGLRVQAVQPHVRGRLLDVGCGTNRLVKAYGNGVGIDVFPWQGVDQLVTNTAHLPFEAASFDTVTIIAALNHIPNREEVVKECRRVLRPGGRLLVTMITPKISRMWHWIRSPWDADQHDRGMGEEEVFGFYPKDLIRIIENLGFRLEWKHRFMFGFNRLYSFLISSQ